MLVEINPQNIDSRIIQEAISILKKGGLIIFPTDTVYAIGCDFYNKKHSIHLPHSKELN